MPSDARRAQEEREWASRLDWLADFVIPAAVFGLLGSLLYFLIDLRQYIAGGEAGILRYVVFWFLVGVIGLARMSARPGSSTVSPEFYCLLLGGAVLLVIFQMSVWEGAFAAPEQQGKPGLALVLNVLTVAGIWVAAWILTAVCTRPEHALEELRHGGLTSRAGFSRATTTPLRAVLVVSGFALAIFGYGLSLVKPDHPLRQHANVCAALYVLFALMLMALINLGAARLAAHVGGLRTRNLLAGSWVAGAAGLVLLVVLLAAALPQAASRWSPRDPTQGASRDGQGGDERWGRGMQPGYSSLPDWGPGGQRPWLGGSEPRQGDQDRQRGAGQEQGEGEQGPLGRMMQPIARQMPNLAWLLWLLVALALLALMYWQRQRIVRTARALLAALARLLAWLQERFRRAGAPGVAQGLPRDPWEDIFAGADPSLLDPGLAVRHVWRATQLFYEGMGLGRREYETEAEFARRVPDQFAVQAAQVKRLARLYVACEYGERLPGAQTVTELRQMWSAITRSVQAGREARAAAASPTR